MSYTGIKTGQLHKEMVVRFSAFCLTDQQWSYHYGMMILSTRYNLYVVTVTLNLPRLKVGSAVNTEKSSDVGCCLPPFRITMDRWEY